MKIAIVDYGMGNLSSVAKAFEALGAETTVSGRAEEFAKADRVVLPGVGAFGEGMSNLRRRGLIEPLRGEVLGAGKPFLGICLGMQLLAGESFEHGRHQGLGWIPGTVRPFEDRGEDWKTIHIGWSDVLPRQDAPLFRGLGASPNFYFVHGYHVACDDAGAVCATSVYGQPFTSAIQRGNLAGVQFHPEKSQETGLALLRNFLQWDPAVPPPAYSPKANGWLFEPHAGGGMPKVRLIPTLLLHDGRLVKTVRFQLMRDGVRRDVGHPVKAPMVYDAQLADELVYLDIRATVEGRGIEQLRRAVSEVAGQIFMPLTAGGGIRTVDDIRRLLQAGADKVAINSAALERPAFITEAAGIFGRQCVVVSLDAKRTGPDGYEVFTHSGTKATGLDPARWARQAEEAGAGEILLTSIDRDGTMEGYDLTLIRRVAEAVTIPVIASGGVGSLEHLAEGVLEGRASAVAAASLFHFRDLSPIKAKAFLRRRSIPIRA